MDADTTPFLREPRSISFEKTFFSVYYFASALFQSALRSIETNTTLSTIPSYIDVY